MKKRFKNAPERGCINNCRFGPQNYTRSIKFRKKNIGSFGIGPFILDTEKINCKILFNQNIENKGLKEGFIKELEKSYNKIPIFTSKCFNENIKKQISLIIRHLKAILNSQIEQRIWGVFKEGEPEGLAHQIYTPIQAIIATAENLYYSSSDSELQDASSTIISQLGSLLKLVEDARYNIEQSIQESIMDETFISFKNEDIIKIIQEVINTLRSEADKKNVTINFKIRNFNDEQVMIQMESDFIRNCIYRP